MNLAVFRGRRFVRFEISPGHLEPGLIRVPVKTPAQPPHVPERHYLWSTCRLNHDEQGATIHYSVQDREQVEAGTEAPQPAAESSPQSLRLIDDDTDMNQRLDDLNAAVADMSASILRQQQEIGELRSALAGDLEEMRTLLAIILKIIAALDLKEHHIDLSVTNAGKPEVVRLLTTVEVVRAVLSRDEIQLISRVFPEVGAEIEKKLRRDAA